MPRIFEKGFTGYNGRMDKKASGLGLYLCKGVCEKLGHGISVASKEGDGTTVMITFSAKKVRRGRSCEYVDLEKSNILFLQKCKIMTRKCKPKKGHYISFFCYDSLTNKEEKYMSILEVNHIKKVYKTRMGGGSSHRIKRCAFQCGAGRICSDHGRIREAGRQRF